jgi:ribose transport system substrate-binding protein
MHVDRSDREPLGDKTPKNRAKKRRWALIAVAISVTLGVSACGSTSSGGASSTPAAGTSSGNNTAAQAVLDAAYKGTTYPLAATGPKAKSGKTVWIISCIRAAACIQIDDGFVAAATALGWTTKVVDDKVDPNTAITEINQAVAAKADAIVLLPFDCPAVQAGLKVAKAAGIPVVNPLGLDCNFSGFGGGESLYAAPLKLMGTNSAVDWTKMEGVADAKVAVAAAQIAGLTPKYLNFKDTTSQPWTAKSKAFADSVAQVCSACGNTYLDFTEEQLGGGAGGPALFRTSLLSNPQANAIYLPFGDILAGGLQQAAQSSKTVKLVCCGNGDPALLAYATNPPAGQTVIMNSYPWTFMGWAQADVLNRVFAGQSPAEMPNEGGYLIYVDKTHNVTKTVPELKAPVDYEANFKKIWSGS